MNKAGAEEIETTIKEIVGDVAPDVRLVPKYGGEVLAPEPNND